MTAIRAYLLSGLVTGAVCALSALAVTAQDVGAAASAAAGGIAGVGDASASAAGAGAASVGAASAGAAPGGAASVGAASVGAASVGAASAGAAGATGSAGSAGGNVTPASIEAETVQTDLAPPSKKRGLPADQLPDNQTTVGELVGQNLSNAKGHFIGQIDDVVMIRGEAMAIIGVGGFLGIGERDVAMPVTELSFQNDRITAMGYTEEQLEAMREYHPESSTPLSSDTPISIGAL